MFDNESGQYEQSSQRIFQRCFLPNIGSFGKMDSEKFIQKSSNQKQELPVAAMFINESKRNEHIYRGPSNNASYQIAIHLAKRFQRRRFFRNQPIRNNNCLWRPCLLTDQNEMSNLYREPSIDAPYQVSVHLAKNFQRRRYFF